MRAYIEGSSYRDSTVQIFAGQTSRVMGDVQMANVFVPKPCAPDHA